MESYDDAALLNSNPRYDKTDVATYFVQYKNEKIDLTAGYFYEQFGSGLLYRSWEDRALGINNALRGGRVIFKPTSYFTLKEFTVANVLVLISVKEKFMGFTNTKLYCRSYFNLKLQKYCWIDLRR